MPSYYIGFDVVITNDLGIPEKQPGAAVEVYNVTDSDELDPVETDDFGVVPAAVVDLSAGKLLRFTVDGYDGEIFRTTTATDTEAYPGVVDLTLELENNFTPEFETAVYNQVFIKGANEAEPVFAGQTAPGEVLKIPYNPNSDESLDIRAIAKTEKGAADVFDLGKAFSSTYAPNRETLTPDFSQNGAALNAVINFLASNFTNNTKHRKIEVATNEAFTTGVEDPIVQADNNAPLGAAFSINRQGSLTGTKDVWVRISHSSNPFNFGTPSAAKMFTFADGGGSGGSGEGHPPKDLHLYSHINYSLGTATLNWVNDGGVSDNEVYQNGVFYGSVSSSTDTYPGIPLLAGQYNYFEVRNDDGSTFWEVYWPGGEL